MQWNDWANMCDDYISLYNRNIDGNFVAEMITFFNSCYMQEGKTYQS